MNKDFEKLLTEIIENVINKQKGVINYDKFTFNRHI